MLRQDRASTFSRRSSRSPSPRRWRRDCPSAWRRSCAPADRDRGVAGLRRPLTRSDPAHVTNQGTDVSWGGGVRAGIEWALAPQFRIGVAGNSRICMHEFENYRGLFAEQGDFDIPASLQAGVAFDATPNLTFLADYKHIWYGSDRVDRQSVDQSCRQLGSDNGPGFGWKDIDIVKVGVEWRNLARPHAARRLLPTTRARLQSRDVLFNILAPAVGAASHHRRLRVRVEQGPVASSSPAPTFRRRASAARSPFARAHHRARHASVGGDGRPQVSLRPGAGSAEVRSSRLPVELRPKRRHEDRHPERLRQALRLGIRIEEESACWQPQSSRPLRPPIGGALIGVSAVILMLFLGRIAGISGIVGRLLPPYGDAGRRRCSRRFHRRADCRTRRLHGRDAGFPSSRRYPSNLPLLAGAGLLVGFGAILGSGCTSGHGVCGLSRLSRRSLVATLIFMATAFITVFVARHVLTGAAEPCAFSSSALAGLVFGLGLIISGMADPAKVLNFLDLFGTWDPSLAFVMARRHRRHVRRLPRRVRRGRPLLRIAFSLPQRTAHRCAARRRRGAVRHRLGTVGLLPGTGHRVAAAAGDRNAGVRAGDARRECCWPARCSKSSAFA